MDKILILTNHDDAHGRAVYDCLLKKKTRPIRWFSKAFLHGQRVSHEISSHSGHRAKLLNNGKEIDLMDVDVVWYRRSGFPSIPQNIHPGDRSFIELENRLHMQSLRLLIGPSAKWVNPFLSLERANSKIFQLREASRLGLSIPKTLVSNDKKIILDFLDENQKEGVIYKSFTPVSWDENSKNFGFYTSVLSKEKLPNEMVLALTPGIYQEKIKKSFELRATFLKDECIAVKIDNRQALDWRTLFSTKQLKIRPFCMPKEIEKKCIVLMQKLGIVFGCFDFIVTPEKDYIFLEVNEMGQFLWIEDLLPELKLLDKFCDFLISRDNQPKKSSGSWGLEEIIHSASYQALVEKDLASAMGTTS